MVSINKFYNFIVPNALIKLDANITIYHIQQKDQKVFKRLYDDLYEDLVGYAFRYLYDKAYSEDVVQEVFISLWVNAERIKINGSLKMYIYRMVRNRCLNFLKTLNVTDEFGEWEEKLLDEPSAIFDMVLNADLEDPYDEMLKNIELLPEKMQKIFRLKYMHNFQYTEIAEILGVSVNTVKTQLKRAKAKLRNSLITIFILLIFSWLQ